MGIHYDYKSTKGSKLMEKQAKRERKLAEKVEETNAKVKDLEETIEEKEREINILLTRLQEKEDQRRKEEEKVEFYWKKIHIRIIAACILTGTVDLEAQVLSTWHG